MLVAKTNAGLSSRVECSNDKVVPLDGLVEDARSLSCKVG